MLQSLTATFSSLTLDLFKSSTVKCGVVTMVSLCNLEMSTIVLNLESHVA